MSQRSTVAEALTFGDPAQVASAVRAGGLPGVTYVESTISQAAATTTVLNNVLMLQSIRVTAGAAAAGARTVGDAGATPSATVVAVDQTVTKADGMRTTLTYEANVTDVVVTYLERTAPAQYIVDDMVDNSRVDPAGAQLQQA